jgi:DNA polymerase-3 subunit epsilon
MRPSQVIVFDVETTGTDRQRDQVIELCVQLGLDDGANSHNWRMRPSVPMTPGAQAVHGITMDDLASAPPFSAYADEIRATFAEARVLIGYNMSFDIEMLQAEYARLQQPHLNLDDKMFVDAFRLWQQCEPRSLQHAHQRFVGDSFAAAHSAAADVAATGRALQGMLRAFNLTDPDAEPDWSTIAGVCEPERATWVGPSRHLRWELDGSVIIGFGKHEGTTVLELASKNSGSYLRWIMNKGFPPHVHKLCKKALALPEDEFHAWVRDTFGEPPRPEPAAAPAPKSATQPARDPAQPARDSAPEGVQAGKDPRQMSMF